MRKVLVIAVREYLAAVKTKAFLIGLLVMPLLMGGSLLIQRLLRDVRDTREKTFAIIDRTPGSLLFSILEKAVAVHNEKGIYDAETGKQIRPRLKVVRATPDSSSADALARLRLELSGQIRDGKLAGFLEIGPSVLEPAPQGTSEERHALRYTSNRPTFRDFTLLAVTVIGESVKRLRAEQAFRGKWEAVEAVMRPVPFKEAGLASRDPDTGEIREGTEETRLAPVLVPVVLTILMFMVVLMGATPLMQGVVEEKMQRIAEVLLGCVGPFQLMLGKLLGNAATSLTITSVYLGGAFWLAHHYNVADQVPLGLLVWFLIFQVLAALMYGSLFIAIGAACSDMKETQSLLWPVMLLACLPMFMLRTVIQEPHGPASSSLSFFPFSTPMLMVARLAVPPPMPLWQPLLGMALVLLTTLTCVWVAGRIFRVGILMQGKGARLADLWRWVIRG